jgi:glycosyltransferase involved in cell wall biosynthesis
VRGDSAELRQLTLRGLSLRLFHSRRDRIARWRKATAPIIARFPTTEPLSSRPKISVCMAAYNGQRYILEQLRSIAPQLGPEDEIVIVDDASQDETCTVIQQFRSSLQDVPGSPTLIFRRHEQNRGVVRTFEDAIRAATGDILFISDDDDRWVPDKVAKVLLAFADPEVQVVSTGMQLIDEIGRPIPSSEFMRHRRFSAGVWANLLHNQFQGSALALRSSVLQRVLPFPKGRLYLHDAWIGMRTILSGGKVVHLEEPLLLYRRHQSNFSRRFSRWKQVKLRLHLVLDLVRGSLHTP